MDYPNCWTHRRQKNDLNWKTVVEVARVSPNDATITEAELMAATEAAKAVSCLTRTGKIQFDPDGNLVETWRKDRHHKRIRNDTNDEDTVRETKEDEGKKVLTCRLKEEMKDENATNAHINA